MENTSSTTHPAQADEKFEPAPHTGRRPNRYTGRGYAEEIWDAARADYIAGATAAEISALYGMCKATVYEHAKRHGWAKTVTVHMHAQKVAFHANAPVAPFRLRLDQIRNG